MADNAYGSADRVRELCRKLKPVMGQSAERIFNAYSAVDAEGKKQIETYVDALAARHLGRTLDDVSVNLVPPSKERVSGTYNLGTVQYNGKDIGDFGLRENEWIQHVAVFGRSGAGKTNLGFEIFRQLKQHGKPVLILDWKRNYRDLLTRAEFQDVAVYTVGRDVAPFRFNPLIPPKGTDAKTWLKRIIEVVATSYMLGDGVLFLLQETLDAVYDEFGLYNGDVYEWPTFRHVMERAQERNAKGRESAWLASTMRALSALNFGEMGNVLSAAEEQQATMEDLLSKSVILEMDALSQADKVFVISALLLWIHHYRMTEGTREVFKHAIMIEEAHHVLSNERRSLIGGQSVMEITFREIREYGESIVVLDQHPSKIAFSALGNTYCSICLNVKHQKDVSATAQSMLLDGDEKDILGSLEVGQAVVKLQGRVPRPFLIRIPEFNIHKGAISDAGLREKMIALGTIQDVTAAAIVEPAYRVSKAGGPSIESEALRLLEDVEAHPEGGIAARYLRLGISVRQGQRIKDKLVEQSLLMEREQRTGIGRVKALALTEQGIHALRSQGEAA